MANISVNIPDNLPEEDVKKVNLLALWINENLMSFSQMDKYKEYMEKYGKYLENRS